MIRRHSPLQLARDWSDRSGNKKTRLKKTANARSGTSAVRQGLWQAAPHSFRGCVRGKGRTFVTLQIHTRTQTNPRTSGHSQHTNVTGTGARACPHSSDRHTDRPAHSPPTKNNSTTPNKQQLHTSLSTTRTTPPSHRRHGMIQHQTSRQI